MSTPHLHTQRLLQDLDNLTKLARMYVSACDISAISENERINNAQTHKEINNIVRRLKKELRRLGRLNGPKKVLP